VLHVTAEHEVAVVCSRRFAVSVIRLRSEDTVDAEASEKESENPVIRRVDTGFPPAVHKDEAWRGPAAMNGARFKYTAADNIVFRIFGFCFASESEAGFFYACEYAAWGDFEIRRVKSSVVEKFRLVEKLGTVEVGKVESLAEHRFVA